MNWNARKKKLVEVRRVLRERKRIRTQRAEIVAAYDEALRMKRSKKKGTADIDKNMEALGFDRISYDNGGTIEQRYRRL